MSQVVGGVVIQLTLVGGADEIILMGAGEGDAINLVPILFRHILPQIPVEKDNEETEEFKITFRRDYLFYLVHKYFLLKIKQVGSQLADGFASFVGRSAYFQFPKSALTVPQVVFTVLPETVFPYHTIRFRGRRELRSHHIGR